MVRVLISTIYEGRANKIAIKELSPHKLIIVANEKSDLTQHKAISELREFYKDTMDIEVLRTSVYDIYKIVKDVISKVDNETKKGNEVAIHVSEGRKTLFLATLFAAYLRKEKIKGAYYVIEETSALLSLPLLDLGLRDTKRKMLQEIIRGNDNINKLIRKLRVKKTMVYTHINDLKKEGYLINDKRLLEPTDFGKICLL